MEIVDTLQINNFGPMPKADVPPSEEESIFVLTSSQLQKIISRALQPLKDRIESLEATITRQDEKIDALKADEKLDHDDIRDLFEAIAAIEPRPSTAPPAPTAPTRGEKTAARVAKVDEVLKSRGPTTLKQLEHILGIDRATMTRLLGKLDMRRYELHVRPGDEREKVLRLRSQIR